MTATLAPALILAISALSILLMLVRPRNIPEVYWVGAGASLLVIFRLIPLKLAGKAVAEGSDVYFFLIGMMLLSALARDNGVFDWVASESIHAAKGSCSRLFLLIYGFGTIVTICMSNDATAVVLTPAVLAAVRRSKVQPLPFLFACAMIANAASLRPSHLQSGEPGCLSLRNATPGTVVRRLSIAVYPVDRCYVCRPALVFPERPAWVSRNPR